MGSPIVLRARRARSGVDEEHLPMERQCLGCGCQPRSAAGACAPQLSQTSERKAPLGEWALLAPPVADEMEIPDNARVVRETFEAWVRGDGSIGAHATPRVQMD